MPKIHYDLHMHSCLSPCADNDMTPYNIVNMAKLCGFDMIALTDHNSSLNCPGFIDAAREAGIAAVPGMELCTSEECHVVCLFPSLSAAMEFSAYVASTLPPLKNDPAVFGEQIIMDGEDTVMGHCEDLLAMATAISIDDVYMLVRKYGGTAFPAHIDRPSYSVIGSLGTVPDAGFHAVEVSRRGDIEALKKEHPVISDMMIIGDSDSHSLAAIREPEPWIELPEPTAAALIAALNGNERCRWGYFQ